MSHQLSFVLGFGALRLCITFKTSLVSVYQHFEIFLQHKKNIFSFMPYWHTNAPPRWCCVYMRTTLANSCKRRQQNSVVSPHTVCQLVSHIRTTMLTWHPSVKRLTPRASWRQRPWKYMISNCIYTLSRKFFV